MSKSYGFFFFTQTNEQPQWTKRLDRKKILEKKRSVSVQNQRSYPIMEEKKKKEKNHILTAANQRRPSDY